MGSSVVQSLLGFSMINLEGKNPPLGRGVAPLACVEDWGSLPSTTQQNKALQLSSGARQAWKH